MPLGVLVVDDEPLARARLIRQLQSVPQCRLLGEAADAREAMALAVSLAPDLILLDIEMPGDSGLDLAHQLSTFDPPPAIVFCTAHDQFALPAFATAAAGYLLKPVSGEQLCATIDRVQQLNRPQRRLVEPAREGPCGRSRIQVVSRRRVELLDVAQIRCFVADSKYVVAHHPGGETILSESLKELETEFGRQLLRVHRNALVAVDFILGLHRDGAHYRVELDGVDWRPLVSRRLLPSVKALIAGMA
ncbi:LytR/AlgR family response regulator transcription factor [Microbulbifer sp. TYP-18]|uniref:LytR/AlgR family response regulator transcription factor n=1 Tax=Microbulbifer sp. TYP-18 TaxID=3230024 RepID=UPI0034C682D4